MKICSIEGCGKERLCKGYCGMHYTRFLKYGDPNRILKPRIVPRPDGLKVCSKCKIPKDLKEFFGAPLNPRSWCRVCDKNYHADKYRGCPKQRKLSFDSMVRRKYGLTPEAWKSLLERQDGVCAICKRPESSPNKKNLSVDHCHTTGKIRGLLCNTCNRGIGLLKDSTALLSAAIEYLKRSDGGTK